MTSELQKQRSQLRQLTGQEPDVRQTSPTTWELLLVSDRVELTIRYAKKLGQRTKWAGSTLKIDGVERPLAQGPEHFAQIWRDPDIHAARKKKEPRAAQLPEVQPRDIATAPLEVRMGYDMLNRRLFPEQENDVPDEEEGVTVVDVTDAVMVAGKAGERWAIGVRGANGGLLMFFRQHKGAWYSDPHQRLVVVVNGADYTAEADGRLDKALAMLAGSPPPPVPGAGSAVGGADAAASNAVTVRRATVMRN